MRRGVFAILMIIVAVGIGGCHKKRTLANFNLHAGMTQDDVDDLMGAPDKSGGHWSAYTMEDGSELRLGFLGGAKGTNRTLTSAALYIGQGPALHIEKVFEVPLTTQPAAGPETNPTTSPAGGNPKSE